MSHHRIRSPITAALLAGSLLLAGACDGSGPLATVEEPDTPALLPSLRLYPDRLFLVVPITGTGTAQFTPFLDDTPIEPAAVRWSIADPVLGSVSPDGVLTTRCFESGSTAVRAELVASPAVRTEASVVLGVPLIAVVSVQSIREASSHQPVDLARVAGTLEVDVVAPALNCREIAAIGLRVISPAGDTLLPARPYDPPVTSVLPASLTWETTAILGSGQPAFPNGEYSLRAVVQYRDGRREVSSGIPLELRNQ